MASDKLDRMTLNERDVSTRVLSIEAGAATCASFTALFLQLYRTLTGASPKERNDKKPWNTVVFKLLEDDDSHSRDNREPDSAGWRTELKQLVESARDMNEDEHLVHSALSKYDKYRDEKYSRFTTVLELLNKAITRHELSNGHLLKAGDQTEDGKTPIFFHLPNATPSAARSSLTGIQQPIAERDHLVLTLRVVPPLPTQEAGRILFDLERDLISSNEGIAIHAVSGTSEHTFIMSSAGRAQLPSALICDVVAQALQITNRRRRLDEEEKGEQCRVIIGVDLVHGAPALPPEGSSFAMVYGSEFAGAARLALGEWNDYAGGVLPKAVRGDLRDLLPTSVLVTAPIAALIDHRFSIETAGELHGGTAERKLVSVVHADLDDPNIGLTKLGKQQAKRLDDLLKTFDGSPKDDRYDITVGSPALGPPLARQVIAHLRRKDFAYLVLRWQCSESCEPDLLTPVADSVRRLLGLNYRTDFRANGVATGAPYCEPELVIRAWVAKNIFRDAHEHFESTVKALRTLALSSGRDEDFAEITAGLIRVLGHLASRHRVRIVVENKQFADVLTERLIEQLPGMLPSEHLLKMYCIKLPDAEKNVLGPDSSVLDGVSADYQLNPISAALNEAARIDDQACDSCKWLLNVAALLGWKFPLIWLRNTWIASLSDGQTLSMAQRQREFQQLLGILLRRGILEYCGTLFDPLANEARKSDNESSESSPDKLTQSVKLAKESACKPFRELRWTDTAAYHSVLGECKEEWSMTIRLAFAMLLDRHYLSKVSDEQPDLGEYHVARSGFLRARCKIRILQILNPLREHEPFWKNYPPRVPLGLVVGWLLTESRAREAQAKLPACKRLEQACRWYGAFSDHYSSVKGEQFQALALAIAEAYAKSEDVPGVLPVQLATKLTSDEIYTNIGEKTDDSKEQLLFILRVFWQRMLWRGNDLDDSEKLAERMKQVAAATGDNHLKLEAAHSQIVTQFIKGRIRACYREARKWIKWCEEGNSSFPYSSGKNHLHSGHDALICCKVFALLCQLIAPDVRQDSTEPDEKGLLDIAKKWSRKNHDGWVAKHPECQQVFSGYIALYHILRHEWREAIAVVTPAALALDGKQVAFLSKGDAWKHFTKLLLACAEIGQLEELQHSGRADLERLINELPDVEQRHFLHIRRERLSELRNDLATAIEKWGKFEYDALWNCYLAVADSLLENHIGSESAADKAFEGAITTSRRRGEIIFLPEVWWFRSRAAFRRNESHAARRYLSEGQTASIFPDDYLYSVNAADDDCESIVGDSTTLIARLYAERLDAESSKMSPVG